MSTTEEQKFQKESSSQNDRNSSPTSHGTPAVSAAQQIEAALQQQEIVPNNASSPTFLPTKSETEPQVSQAGDSLESNPEVDLSLQDENTIEPALFDDYDDPGGFDFDDLSDGEALQSVAKPPVSSSVGVVEPTPMPAGDDDFDSFKGSEGFDAESLKGLEFDAFDSESVASFDTFDENAAGIKWF